MSQETITIIGSAVSLGILNISLYRMLDARISHVETGLGDLRERMARLEGLFEGFTQRERKEA